jgi:hypothetical protein
MTIVKDYVFAARQRQREMFVPLAHEPGHAQVYFCSGQWWVFAPALTALCKLGLPVLLHGTVTAPFRLIGGLVFGLSSSRYAIRKGPAEARP